jgi:hypothetical protein
MTASDRLQTSDSASPEHVLTQADFVRRNESQTVSRCLNVQR